MELEGQEVVGGSAWRLDVWWLGHPGPTVDVGSYMRLQVLLGPMPSKPCHRHDKNLGVGDPTDVNVVEACLLEAARTPAPLVEEHHGCRQARHVDQPILPVVDIKEHRLNIV